MPHVRARLQAASKEVVRRRAERNRVMLAPGRGERFTGAFDWFRAAMAYARRRSYRTPEAAGRAHARLGEILAQAAAVLEQHAAEMDAIVPSSRLRVRRFDLRQACGRAQTVPARMEAARQWFLFLAAQTRREPGETATVAAVIQDRAAAWFIKWAEEMDADDYGE